MADLETKLKYKRNDLEDWTKIEDKILRKKIQDRLAKRKARSTDHKPKRQKQGPLPVPLPLAQAPTKDLLLTFPTRDETLHNLRALLSTLSAKATNTSGPFTNSILCFALSHYLSPLNDPHHLPLPQYSLYRAFIANTNILALRLQDLENDDCLSPWTTDRPYPVIVEHDLVPSSLQLEVRHHPYIDLIAPRGVREGILRALKAGWGEGGKGGNGGEEGDGVEGGDGGEDALCEALHTGAFLVWGEWGWDASGWEVSQTFLDQWGWLVDDETIRVSNSWREGRGEKPLDLKGRDRGRVEELE